MWLENTRIQGAVNTGALDPRITSTKLIISNQCCNCTCHCHGHGEGTITIDPNNPLRIHAEITRTKPNTTIWIGLIVSNEGTIPYRITNIQITPQTNTTIYIYGPYQSPSSDWSHASQSTLPYPGWTTPPSNTCQPSQKLIVWIKIQPTPQHHCKKQAYDIELETQPFNT